MLISLSAQRSSNVVVSNQRPTLAIAVDVMPLGFAWVSQCIPAVAPLSISRRAEVNEPICHCLIHSFIVQAMTTQRAYALGYLIAGLIFAPLTAWAKVSSDGAWFLYIAVSMSIIACILIRICTGEWP